MPAAKKQVAIIGGGITGLTAAYRLSRQANVAVVLFEKSGELGGLAAGFALEHGNLEQAYHHLFATDTDILKLIADLDLEPRLKWHASSVANYVNGKIYPFTTPLDLLRFSPLPITDRLRTGLIALYLRYNKNWRKFSKISALSWMRKFSGEQASQVLWKPLLKGKFDRYFDKISMAWLWARLHIRSRSRRPGITGEALAYPEQGFQIIIQALKNKIIAQGGKIYLNAAIQSIAKQPGGLIKITNENSVQEFNAVVAAIPSPVFANLIKNNREILPQYLEKLRQVDYLGAVCAVFSSPQKLSDFYWHNIMDEESPFIVFLRHTQLVGAENFNGQEVYYIAKYAPHEHRYFSMNETEIFAEWYGYLNKIFPAFRPELITEQRLFRFKNAQHIVDTDYENKIPDYRSPVPGVYLSNFTQIYPEDRGTNLAVRDGEAIAKMVMQDIK